MRQKRERIGSRFFPFCFRCKPAWNLFSPFAVDSAAFPPLPFRQAATRFCCAFYDMKNCMFPGLRETLVPKAPAGLCLQSTALGFGPSGGCYAKFSFTLDTARVSRYTNTEKFREDMHATPCLRPCRRSSAASAHSMDDSSCRPRDHRQGRQRLSHRCRSCRPAGISENGLRPLCPDFAFMGEESAMREIDPDMAT